MKTHVEFRFDRFPPYETEANAINSGRFGKRLAEFLSTSLCSHGFVTMKIRAEDWGWVVPVRNDGFRLWIGCGNYDEYPDGFLCFIEPHEPVIYRLSRQIDTKARIEAFQTAIDLILPESAGVRNKKWWTYEEFNNLS